MWAGAGTYHKVGATSEREVEINSKEMLTILVSDAGHDGDQRVGKRERGGVGGVLAADIYVAAPGMGTRRTPLSSPKTKLMYLARRASRTSLFSISEGRTWPVELQQRVSVQNRTSMNVFGTKFHPGDAFWYEIVLQRGRLARNRTPGTCFATKSYSDNAFWYEIVLQEHVSVRNRDPAKSY